MIVENDKTSAEGPGLRSMLLGEARDLLAHQPQHLGEGPMPGPALIDHLSFFHVFVHSSTQQMHFFSKKESTIFFRNMPRAKMINTTAVFVLRDHMSVD